MEPSHQHSEHSEHQHHEEHHHDGNDHDMHHEHHMEHEHQMSHEGHEHHMGHDHSGHHKMMIQDFKRRFWVSLVLSVPVLILSPMIQQFFSFQVDFPGRMYVLLGLSTLVYFYGGWPFLKGLWDELRQRNPGMMTLIAVAITVAYAYSAAVALGLTGKVFFWELMTLIDIMLVGHWVEMRSVLGASKALELLVNMMPSEAHVIRDGQTVDVKLEEVQKGDLLLIKPGEKIPADGEVTEGESHVNESMLTGESKPAKKDKGDNVIGGSVNGNGSLTIKVEHTGKDSYLNKVITMVQEAQQTKSKTQHLADRAAKWLTYVALSAGAITLTVWLLAGYEFVFALERMVTVMVISCPHALGLAIPLVAAISTSISAQNGLLIRNRTAFENSRKITAIVFDKTGTLTKGEFGVTRIETVNNQLNQNELLKLAAALENSSEHPIAVGIAQKAKAESIDIPEAKNFSAITGKGIEGNVTGKAVKVVSPGYLKEKNIEIPEAAFKNEAETIVFVLIDNTLAGYIALADEIRPESVEAIKTLKDNGIKVIMATGDNKKVAQAVSDQLGLDEFYSEVLPHEKVDVIKELQAKGEFVAMTGDGVNDAPALAQADVGIAVGSGTDVAAETADIVLVESNPKDIAGLILFGKATYNKMVQNLVWATAYNTFAIPLAAGVLYPIGFMLSPALGAVFMSLSTVIVAINAQLLKRKLNTTKTS